MKGQQTLVTLRAVFSLLLAAAALYGAVCFTVYSVCVAHTNDLADPEDSMCRRTVFDVPGFSSRAHSPMGRSPARRARAQALEAEISTDPIQLRLRRSSRPPVSSPSKSVAVRTSEDVSIPSKVLTFTTA